MRPIYRDHTEILQLYQQENSEGSGKWFIPWVQVYNPTMADEIYTDQTLSIVIISQVLAVYNVSGLKNKPVV
jgi:hypothetical protein